MFFSTQPDRAAYSGQLRKADELSRRAVASAQHAGQKETAEAYDTAAALRQAIFGHPADARKRATAALNVSKGLDVEYQAALARALTGDTAQAQALATDLNKQFPQDTIVQSKKNPDSERAACLEPERTSESHRGSSAGYSLRTGNHGNEYWTVSRLCAPPSLPGSA